MAFTGNYLCDSFLRELFEAKHNFLLTGGNTFKIAMYTNTAAFTDATTIYTSINEVSGTGYTGGGGTLTRIDPALSAHVAYCDFADYTWTTATVTAYGAMIYNVTATNAAVVILDFGGAKTSTAGDFTIQFPTAGTTTAIIRLVGPNG